MPGAKTAVDTRAVATLANAGFVDLFRRAWAGKKDYTAPTRYGGGDEFSQMRVDYILATEPLARLAKQCYVSEATECETASDHYPVVAELDLELTT
jgi:exonuclease III